MTEKIPRTYGNKEAKVIAPKKTERPDLDRAQCHCGISYLIAKGHSCPVVKEKKSK